MGKFTHCISDKEGREREGGNSLRQFLFHIRLFIHVEFSASPTIPWAAEQIMSVVVWL